jgi:hypothetical protein
MAMDAGEFGKFVKEELKINAEIAKAAGISAHYRRTHRTSGSAGELISSPSAAVTSTR